MPFISLTVTFDRGSEGSILLTEDQHRLKDQSASVEMVRDQGQSHVVLQQQQQQCCII